jgi:hypothetical protein
MTRRFEDSKITFGQTIIFLHIHKAAGTTLTRIINRRFDSTAIYSVDPNHWRQWDQALSEFKNLSKAQRKKFRVIEGHMYFGLHQFLSQPSTYITLVRDPVDRIVSMYYYIRRNPKVIPYHAEINRLNMSLKDFVRSGMALVTDNGQTRFLSGVYDVGYGQCDRSMLERAKRNMQKYFSVVGVKERFDETVLLLRRIFDFPFPFYQKQNVTRNRPYRNLKDMPKDTLDCIRQYNELDIELYEYAQRQFRDRIAQKSPFFRFELAMYKLGNQVYNKIR